MLHFTLSNLGSSLKTQYNLTVTRQHSNELNPTLMKAAVEFIGTQNFLVAFWHVPVVIAFALGLIALYVREK